jgi:two-component sensor histidine kinase
MLNDLLLLTDSRYGYIGEVLYKEDGTPYQVCRSVTDISWNEETRRYYQADRFDGLLFEANKSLADHLIVTGEPVISNDPAVDSGSGGIPDGHPMIDCFLGLPVYVENHLVGSIGLANRATGYAREMIDFLKPYVTTCGRIIEAFRSERRRKEAEDRLRASLQEKEVLIREVHHRVKNNLQIICSLLNLQAGHLKDESLLRIFQDAQNRVRAMAVVHEKLYFSANLARLRIDEYVGGLVEHLLYSYPGASGHISAIKDVESIGLDLDTAIPLGLLISELVSNSLKHAFPEGRRGVIKITLRRLGKGMCELIVSDDGIGLQDAQLWKKPATFGMELIDAFVRQLDGRIEMQTNGGTEFKIEFKVDERSQDP